MDFSAANTALWNPVIQIGIIALLILAANVLRRKISIIQKSMLPTAVIAGFILLLIRQFDILPIDTTFMEMLTYHALGIGFIAMSLRTPSKEVESEPMIGMRSGALIVSTYLVQAAVGLIIAISLAYTVMPDLFKASGLLLPMAYGQGPGQANNVGSTYEALGMIGGRSFGLSLAAMGYLCACIVGVILLNVLTKSKKFERVSHDEISGSVTIDTYQDNNEIPIQESIDKLSIQVALVVGLYLITFLVTWGITGLVGMASETLALTVSALLWGFNFIIGAGVAIACRSIFKQLRSAKIMNRQYQNNYLLSRISGLAFDVMIVSGIAGIEINDLKGYWLPFILMAVAGGVVTMFWLWYMSKKLYPNYRYEGFISMYGMLTGTVSSGVLLLRELDPHMKTPAANNLVLGSSFGIIFGAPVLILVSLAAQSDFMTLVTLALVLLYLAILMLIIFKAGSKKKSKKAA